MGLLARIAGRSSVDNVHIAIGIKSQYEKAACMRSSAS
jgi:hypothetical protein